MEDHASIVFFYLGLQKRCESVGLTLTIKEKSFIINEDELAFRYLDAVHDFLTGYERAYDRILNTTKEINK